MSSPEPTSVSIDSQRDSDITLFVKAGADGVRYGACPFCHRLFMLLILKSQTLPDLRFRVMTVTLAKAPTDFKQHSLRRVPALVDTGTGIASDNIDDIVQYFADYYPTPELSNEWPDAAVTATNNLFHKFCFYVKEVSKDSSGLLGELNRLDTYLGETGWPYLCGPFVTHMDIELWPKLHQIRIAARYLKDFVIPSHLVHVWQYMSSAYGCPAFVESCPSDQEIILHWADKPETLNLTSEQNSQLAKQEPMFSFDIPK